MNATFRVVFALLLTAGPAIRLSADQIVSYPGSNFTTATGYDAVNNVVAGSYVDSLGHTLGYTYDVGSQSYTSVSYPAPQPRRFTTRKAGRKSAVTPTPPMARPMATPTIPALPATRRSTIPVPTRRSPTPTTPPVGRSLATTPTASGTRTRIRTTPRATPYTNDDLPGQLSTYTYDATGGQQVGQYTDMLGQVHGFVYDAQSHLLTTVDGPAGNTTVYSYDALSQIASVQDVDNLGHTTSYFYDAKSGTLTPYSVPGATSTYLQRTIGAIKSALDHYDTAGRPRGRHPVRA